MADNTIIVEIELDEKGAVKDLNKFEGAAKKSGKEAGKGFSNSFSDTVSRTIGSLLGNLGADLVRGALSGIRNEIGNIVGAASKLEVIETQFKTILKSTKAAQDQLQDLQDFAATTPFQIEGLANSTRQLLSFGVASEDIIPTLRQLGDLAAGTGAEIEDLTIPFGRLVSTQKLTLVELDKFADRGINLYGKLAEQTGLSLKTIRDDISKGRVPFEEFTKALTDLTSEGGTFFEATQAQSKTLSGVLSTLGDNLFNLRATFGKAFSPVLITVVDKITTSIQSFNKSIADNFNVFDDVLIPITKVGDAIITFIVAPLELLTNVFSVVQNGVNVFVSGIVAGFGQIASAGGKLLQFFSPDSGVAQGLITFGETSKEVLADVSSDAVKSFSEITDFPFSEKLAQKNEELRAGLIEQRAIIAEESIATSEVATTAAASLLESNSNVASSLFDLFGSVSVSINQTSEQMAAAAKKIGAIIKGGLGKAIAGGIQNVVNSLLQGKDAFGNFAKFILSTFGDLAIQLGQFFIVQGIAVEALKSLGGAAAIAAGAALVALGTILKSAGGGGSALSGAGGGGGGGAQPAFAGGAAGEEDGVIADPDSLATAEKQTVFNLNVEGSLVQQQELGTFIAETLNESGAKEGVVLTDVTFA